MAGGSEAIGDHVVDDQPDRAAPVALGVEAWIVGIVRGHDIARFFDQVRYACRERRRSSFRNGCEGGQDTADGGAVDQLAGGAVETEILAVRVAPQPLHRRQAFCGAVAVGFGNLALAERFSEVGKVGAGADQDGVETGVDDLKRRSVVQPGIVPTQRAKMLQQPEIPIVLFLGRAMRRIGVQGVAAGVGLDAFGRHAFEGVVPVDRIVAAGLPGMDDGDQPLAFGIAVFVEPAVPGIDLRQQRTGPLGCQFLVPGAVEQAAHRKAGDGRLGDAGSLSRAAGAPDIWPGKIAVVPDMKDDVRHHAVRPLVGEQGVDLGPGPCLVIVGEAKRGQAGIPVPLEGIKTLGRDGVGALVIFPEHLDGAGDGFVDGK